MPMTNVRDIHGPPEKVRLRYIADMRSFGEFGCYLADEVQTPELRPMERLDAFMAAKVQRHGYALRYPDGHIELIWRTNPCN